MSAHQEQARQKIAQLIAQYNAMNKDGRAAMTESSVVHQFIDPFLEALGWPIHDPERCTYELNTQVGRPDMTLMPESGGTVFLEAKRFGIIKELAQARKTIRGIVEPGQMALPGMAVDRTPEEQQAINYAFQNGGTWAILANFEKLRLFNARRDWLVLSFETPQAYLTEFDLLWQLSYEQVTRGGLEALSNQRHREDVDTDYLNFINEWRERLAQDIIARPQDNAWAFDEAGDVKLVELRAVVQRFLDRLVVVRFAEDHLIVPPGTLQSFYELNKNNPYTFTLTQHFQNFFRRFDEAHNSALFAPDLADRAVVGDAVLGGLTQKLYEARYRALSADIMGNTYEQYLGKTLVQRNGQVSTADNLETRKKQGSYYTPQVIVRYLVDNALGRHLYATANGRPDGEPLPDETPKTAADIRHLHLLDPACGSGSFLIYAYQVLADFYRRELARLEGERQARLDELIGQGVTTPIDLQIETAVWKAEIERLQNYPRLILETHLYGVDLDPQAAEIATVNLIMRAMADMPRDQKRLPLILNQNVKVGNSLIGAGPDDARYAEHAADLAEIRRLRRQLVADAEGATHANIWTQIRARTEAVSAALNTALAAHFADVGSIRPFHWAVEFPEVFVDESGQARGEAAGFQIVVGNPPWEIVKPDLREYYAQFDDRIESKLNRKQAEKRIAELAAGNPKIAAGWDRQKARIEASAAYYSKSDDYTRQGRGDRATHKLFVERSYDLLSQQGRLGFVIPSGIYTDLGTKPLREMLFNDGRIEYLYNFSNERFFFSAVHHSFKFTLLGAQKGETSDGFWATFRFNPRVAVRPDELSDFLADPENLVFIRLDSVARFSPDSLSVMEFQTQSDYDISVRLFDKHLLLRNKSSEVWNVKLNREFDMAIDRELLNQSGLGYPYFEGKMIHQFEPFYSAPQYWITDENIGELPQDKRTQLQSYRIAHRRIARTTDERTLISTLVPRNCACDTNATVALIENNDAEQVKLYLCTLLNSFVIDFVIRYKVSTTLNMFYMYQLPVPRLISGDPHFDAIVPRAARLTCTRPEFADLWQEVMGEPWDASKGATDPAAREHLRHELDAIVAHLYGLSRADFAHILDTFPLVFPPTSAGQMKKETLLAIFDRLAPEFAKAG